MKSKIKILSADDLEVNQKLVQCMLKTEKYSIDKAYNGEELIKKMNYKKYDLILMDIQMPILDGIEATKIIRSKKEYFDIPIIAISSYNNEDVIRDILESGVNSYLIIPLKRQDLLIEIERFL